MSIAKQINLFGKDAGEIKSPGKYSTKIEAPIYEPKNAKPPTSSLYDQSKTDILLRNIRRSNVPQDVRDFLMAAAARHTVFNYERIADYYAHADAETQRLFEESALVIIDFESAIERGFVRLTSSIKEQYLEEYPDADS